MGFSRAHRRHIFGGLFIYGFFAVSLLHSTESVDPDKTSDGISNSASTVVWSTLVLSCPVWEEEQVDHQLVVWITPEQNVIVSDGDQSSLSENRFQSPKIPVKRNQSESVFLTNFNCSDKSAIINLSDDEEESQRFSVTSNGSLMIKDLGWIDRGLYRCHVGKNITSEVIVDLDPEYRWNNYLYSLIYGFATAGAFLLITLLFKLTVFLLETYGCCLCCGCCKNRLPPKAKRIKNALDSIESYKQQQLDKLKESYTQQIEWIRQNCANQMERVRENYHGQVQNVKDFRQYGSTQIQAVREQYFDQMQRIRDYSLGQLERAQENYITQRQRLRKFSAQNYLRMRATGKYTQRTLNKVMENLPPLYLDLTTCKHGSVDDVADGFPVEELEPFEDVEAVFSKCESFYPPLVPETPVSLSQSHQCPNSTTSHTGYSKSQSAYFTPDSTLGTKKENDKTKASSLKSTPVKEQNSFKKHKKSKSFSHYLPQLWIFGSNVDSFDNKSSNSRSNNTDSGNVSASNSDKSSRLQSQQVVKAIVERATTSNDYIDVPNDEAFSSPANDENMKVKKKGDESFRPSTSSLEDVIVVTTTKDLEAKEENNDRNEDQKM